jgi:type IV secretory pathway TrbD component
MWMFVLNAGFTFMTHVLHPSLVTPNLILGAERFLALTLLISSAALVLGVGVHWSTIGLAVFLLTVGLAVARRLAKYDPQCSWVYMRHRSYQDIYPATGSVTPKAYPVYSSVPSRSDISGWKVW